MSPEIRVMLKHLIAETVRHRTAVSTWGNCCECGGELHPERFTEGCDHCKDRRQNARRRGYRSGTSEWRGLIV